MEYVWLAAELSAAFATGMLAGAAGLYIYFIDELDRNDGHRPIPPHYPGH